MIQPLNYSRQISKQFLNTLAIPSASKESKEVLSHIVDLVKASHKFMLPDGGIVCDDRTFKALDESVPLRLPYPFIALEFPNHNPQPEPGRFNAPKQVVFAVERDDGIVITPVIFAEHMGIWVPWPQVFIDSTNYIDRSNTRDGCVQLKIRNANSNSIPNEDFADDVMALLSFLNILKCRNVQVEKVVPKKQSKCKSALPFDTYHVLTIGSHEADCQHLGGSHRSPREHIRRGHIRCLQSGKSVWVNAALVSSGRGFGVVTKDYRLRVTK